MVNYKKLRNSKWTAVFPKNNEKHFSVIKVLKNSEDLQLIDSVTLEAVITGRSFKLTPQDLKDREVWLEGWK
jgi:tryptophan-rich hypothetical protein